MTASTATNTVKTNKGRTPTEQRAAAKPGWTFVLTGMVSPAICLIIYAVKQRSWAYMNILLVLLAVLFVGADAEGNQKRGLKVGGHLTAGAVAALVAQNNKKKAKKDLGLVLDGETV